MMALGRNILCCCEQSVNTSPKSHLKISPSHVLTFLFFETCSLITTLYWIQL